MMRSILLSLMVTLLYFNSTLQAQPMLEKKIQTQLIMVEDGGTIELPAGKIEIIGSLAMEGKKKVTIKGAGMDKTILSFKGQKEGAQGLKIANSESIILEDFTIQDALGDGIKTQEVDGISFVRIKAEWTGKASKKNGAYGLYPVQCQNVLIDECVAIGASDAGIYVGQSHQIIVRNSRAYRNVAGIEIENSTMADVYNNIAEGNTGGILVFDLPGLIKKKGGNVRIYNNTVQANNYRNFAPKGNTVADIPPGTGVMVLAASDVEIFDNQILDNKTVGTSVVSYYITERKFEDDEYDPYAYRVHIHDNTYRRSKNGKMMPTWSKKIGLLLFFKFGRKVPDILVDGIFNPEHLDENGDLKPNFKICINNNENAAFANLDAENDFEGLTEDLTGFDCTSEPLLSTTIPSKRD